MIILHWILIIPFALLSASVIPQDTLIESESSESNDLYPLLIEDPPKTLSDRLSRGNPPSFALALKKISFSFIKLSAIVASTAITICLALSIAFEYPHALARRYLVLILVGLFNVIFATFNIKMLEEWRDLIPWAVFINFLAMIFIFFTYVYVH